MDIEKFINKNYYKLYSICEKSAMMMLPLKKSYGYSTDTDLSDEAEFIYNMLEELLSTMIDDEEEVVSGWYNIRVNRSKKSIDITISFEIDNIIIDF